MLISREIGINICLWWKFLVVIVFINQFAWLPMKTCMVGDVGLLLDGLKWDRLFFFVPILSIRL